MTYREYCQHVQEDFKNFIPKKLDLIKPVPLVIKIGGSYFNVPRLLDKIPTGAFYDAEDVAKGMKDDKSTAILSPLVCGIFLQPGIDKVYDSDRAVELAEVLRDEHAWKVCSLTPFFLMSSIGLLSGIMKGAKLWLTHQKSWRQAQTGSHKDLDSFSRLIPFQGIQGSQRMN
jgi:hypothetical protein